MELEVKEYKIASLRGALATKQSQRVGGNIVVPPGIATPFSMARNDVVLYSLLTMMVFFILLFNLHTYAESRGSIDDIIDSLDDELSDNVNLPPETITEERENNDSFIYKPKAKVIILNKITAKSELVEFELGKAQVFGNIVVEVKKCAAGKDPVKSSNLMLLTVFDKKVDSDKSLIFAGWLDSSNLSVSTVEHPVYDVIPKECG